MKSGTWSDESNSTPVSIISHVPPHRGLHKRYSFHIESALLLWICQPAQVKSQDFFDYFNFLGGPFMLQIRFQISLECLFLVVPCYVQILSKLTV